MFAEDQLEMPLFKEYTKMHTSQKAIHICLKGNPTGYVRTACFSYLLWRSRPRSSFLFSVQCDPFVYPSFWTHRRSYSWWGIEDERLRVRWVVLGLTVPHRAVPETNCAILCSLSSGLPPPLPYSKYSSTPEEAVTVCVLYLCVHVWYKRLPGSD